MNEFTQNLKWDNTRFLISYAKFEVWLIIGDDA